MDPRTTVMRTTTTLSGLVLALVGCMHPGAAQTVAIPVVVSATANTPTCTLQAISFVTQYTETISSTLSMSNTFTDFTITLPAGQCGTALNTLVALGTPVPTVVISTQANVNGEMREYRRITLSNVVFTSVAYTATLVETIKMTYGTIATRWIDGPEEIKTRQGDKKGQ